MEWHVLESLSAADQRSLLARCRRRRFPRGGFVFHEGDPGESAHLIDSGTVAVRVTSPMGDVVTLDVLAAGDAFGEQALLGNLSTRSATVVALEPTETMSFTRAEFESLWDNHPDAARAVAAMLDARLRSTGQALLDALYLPVETRVLRRLVRLADIYVDRPSRAIPLTQDDLASMVGTTRQTVNRVLGQAQEEGLVTLARGRIVVDDPTALARRAR